jgi:hypothetical protein
MFVLKKYPNILCFLFFISLTSCGNKIDFTSQKKSTDSLKNELTIAYKQFNTMDSVKINSAYKQINELFSFINPRIKDTISRDEASALSEFKNISKAFKKYTRTKKDLERYYKFNVTQLENLSFDLEKGNFDNKDTVSKYYNQEVNANAQLLTMMKLHSQIIPQKLKKYDSLVPVVLAFARKLNEGKTPTSLEKK